MIFKLNLKNEPKANSNVICCLMFFIALTFYYTNVQKHKYCKSYNNYNVDLHNSKTPHTTNTNMI